jgi:hypothetical protein
MGALYCDGKRNGRDREERELYNVTDGVMDGIEKNGSCIL